MKNAVIVILVLATLGFGYFTVQSKLKMPLGDKGKTAKIVRSDLTLPINATGEIKAARRIVVKAEASGEIIEILKEAGQQVHEGELLIRLDEEEEQRSVERAKLDVQITEARLIEAQTNLEQTQTADIQAAQARVDQIQASLEYTKFQQTKVEELPADKRLPDELVQRNSAYRSQLAQLEGAKADLAKVRLSGERAEQLVAQAKATHETAKRNLEDANRRLKETKIIAPIDGILAVVPRHKGEVIQGGKTTFTGGTELALILDTSKMVVRAEVDEADIGRVLDIAPPWAQPGNDGSVRPPGTLEKALEEVEHLPKITVEAFREEEFVGVIERLYPEPKIINNVVTYQVDVLILGENRSKLLPGMRADVSFTSEHIADAVLCPNEAIREGPNGELGVYVPPAEPAAEGAEPEFIVCKVGLSNGSFSEIKEGLKEGTMVYTKMPRIVAKKKDKKKNR
jgi:multidrug efflux pump subunit AcrA (membrane-fusion protein)